MVTARMIRSGGGYAGNHLRYSDYLDREHQVEGIWLGDGAKVLGLEGLVTNEQFENLRQGLHPDTAEPLRARRSKDVERARAGFDFIASAPKSVSIQASLTGDTRIDRAHFEAAQVLVKEMERLVETRVRKGGAFHNRPTQNLAVAAFQHHASRSLDPQLHTHLFVMNVTLDPVENRWKAVDARVLYDNMDYLTEVYRHALACELRQVGYSMVDVHDADGRDHGFELLGVSHLNDRFSQRSHERDLGIKAFFEAHGRKPTNNEVTVIVRETREKKLIKIRTQDVRARQLAKLSSEETQRLEALKEGVQPSRLAPNHAHGKEVIRCAAEKLFERVSVSSREDIFKAALIFARGKTSLDVLTAGYDELVATGELISAKDGRQVASHAALVRERELLAEVDAGRGMFAPLGNVERAAGVLPDHFADGQRTAILGVLGSRDRFVAVQGAAGTGKTTVLSTIAKEASRGFEVVALAPTASAVGELQSAGLTNAMTIAHFQQSGLEGRAGGPRLIIVDEAAMVGTTTMHELATRAAHGDRFLFSGDTKQLHSVDAGDALRIMAKESSLKTFHFEQVFRQQGSYREAMETLRHDPVRGFEKIEHMGALHQIPEAHLADAAADQYLSWCKDAPKKASQRQASPVLAVCPTWKEIHDLTAKIRERLHARGALTDERTVTTITPLNWTLAERRHVPLYTPGVVLHFHKATTTVARGESVTVRAIVDGQLHTQTADGTFVRITGKQAKCFHVFAAQGLQVASGDKLLLRENARAPRGGRSFASAIMGGKPFSARNGQIVTVKGFTKSGQIQLDDGRILPQNYQHFTHGYAVTTHASQGKTVSKVLVMGASMSHNNFYVAATRGRHALAVFTTDRDQFRHAITRQDERLSAQELMRTASAEQRRQHVSDAVHRDRREQEHRASARQTPHTHTTSQRTADYSRSR